MNHKIDYLFGLLVGLKIRVNLVCLRVISHSLVVAFEILENGGSVVVEVGVRLFLQSFGLCVGFQSEG
jgi:acyl-CoA thioesterase FadM